MLSTCTTVTVNLSQKIISKIKKCIYMVFKSLYTFKIELTIIHRTGKVKQK